MSSSASQVDLLLPLGTGSQWDNNELRYMLRSLHRYASGWRTLWIVGEKPGFLVEDDRVRFVAIPERTEIPKDARVAWKQLHAMERIPEMLEDIVLMNDDYIITQAVDLSKIPAFHRSTSLGHAAKSRARDVYGLVLEATSKYLRENHRSQLHFDVHMPCRIARERYLLMRQQWTDSASSPNGFVVRSLYHNWHGTEGQLVADLKFGPKTTPERITREIAHRWVFSYGDAAIESGVREFLEKKFPVPTEWECDTAARA